MRRVLATSCLIALLTAIPVLAQRSERAAARAAARAAKRAAREKIKGRETPLEKWNRMTPEDRRRALAKLPAERRQMLQRKLQQFRSLPPEERQQLREQYESFSELTPEQQNRARELFRQFNTLADDRRPVVRQELEQLRSLTETERRDRINSQEFHNRLSPAEQQMLQDLAQVFGTTP